MFKWFRSIFTWALPASLIGGILILVYLLLSQRENLTVSSQVNASTVESAPVKGLEPEPDLGPRHQLTYQQWVALLGREATAIAQHKPNRLYVLTGDSLSLWFPTQLLPPGATWLNQGISGETSYGLLHRVKLLDQTQPKIIFVMIGINDLIHGVRQETLVANQREIVRHLKTAHPQAKIVIQSILPHGGDRTIRQYPTQTARNIMDGEQAPTEKERLKKKDLEKEEIESTTAVPTPTAEPIPGKNQAPAWLPRLSAIPNTTIRRLNQRLAAMAQEERVDYLDLHTGFTDEAGNIQSQLTTDGLHLSLQGYEVWRSQLKKYQEYQGNIK